MRVLVTFLGANSYTEVAYFLDGDGATGETCRTPYVQEALLKLLPKGSVDRVVLLHTATSKKLNWEREDGLKSRFERLGFADERGNLKLIKASETLSSEKYWEWFQELLASIGDRDTLLCDMTHGWRIMSIALSSALHFLQRTRSATLEAVYYGVWDKGLTEPFPIVDARAFFHINEWADAVARLVDEADARKLARLAEQQESFHFQGLADPELNERIAAVTRALRNVEANGVAEATRRALEAIARKKATARGAELILLELVERKFGGLGSAEPVSGRYDTAYFRTQLAFVRALFEHELWMQAFTALREATASVALAGTETKIDSKKGRDARKNCDAFFNTLQLGAKFDPERFSGHDRTLADEALAELAELAGRMDALHPRASRFHSQLLDEMRCLGARLDESKLERCLDPLYY